MRVQVLVRLKPGVLDVQGKAVENGLKEMGYSEISNVRVGKVIELDIDAPNLEKAKPRIEEFCQKLLINPIIENYEIRAA